MIDKLQNILEKSKISYRESVLLGNDKLEESLLSILSDIKYLIENYENSTPKERKMAINKNLSKEDEIQKIYRKIPQWLKKPHQLNHQILVTFMRLSNSNEFPIPLSTLERSCEMDSKKFNSNFDQMKTISEKNHGKVFEEKSGNVILWEPVSEFVVFEYKKQF
ncbi:MAG: hypothetical protein WCR69_05585 [Sulfuricurvum sp.]